MTTLNQIASERGFAEDDSHATHSTSDGLLRVVFLARLKYQN